MARAMSLFVAERSMHHAPRTLIATHLTTHDARRPRTAVARCVVALS